MLSSNGISHLDGSIRAAKGFHSAASGPAIADGRANLLCQGSRDGPRPSDVTVEVSPRDIVKRQTVSIDGIRAEIVQATRRERTEFRFDAPVHLLALFERGARSEGESSIEGAPTSSLKDFKGKLVFVPAGHSYHDWQQPDTLTRAVFFYLDPACPPMREAAAADHTPFTPRLFVADPVLRGAAIKLVALIESSKSIDRLYFDALGVVLAHEIVRFAQGRPRIDPPVRGGLTPWQQRILVDYIEEHLNEPITLATLAHLARLSPYYFCRAFKQSFGTPPHRYHTARRIERAKALLAQPRSSVTNVALSVGFHETSSFTAAFHKAMDLTPTAYRRSLT